MDASMDQLAMTSESQFNSTVLLEIDIWRDSNPGYFSSPTELCTSDFPMLLKIILHAGGLLGFKLLDFQSCRDHIIADFALAPILLDAYKTGLFFNLTSHPSFLPLKHDDDTEFESGPLVRSESDRSIKAAFEQKYIGNLPELFVDTLSKYSESASGVEASRRAYNRSISVIQSSGMGKSRLVEEAANLVFTIPINLREELANGTRAYPPPDIELREFFGTHALKSDALLQAEYAMFLMTLFDCVASEAKRLIMGSMGGTLAVKWANFLKEGQNIDDVGQNRKELYANVVCKTREKLAILETTTSPSGIKKLCNPTTLAFLFSDLRTSLNELLGVLGPPRHGRNLCYVYFDEAHGLTAKPPSNAGPLCHKSPYHNLGKVLSEICEQDTFFIFLSTNSNLRQFAPPPISHPSLRVSQGYTLFPPFTELPFDIFFPEMFKHILKTQKHATLDNVCTRGVMSSFGRPMWALHYKMWKEQQDTKDRFINGQLLNYGPALRDIITFAMDKLIAHGATDRVFQSKLAAISVRVGISFDSATELSRQIEAQLVESHMRIVYAIPEHREYMRTGSPSEPILAEAAARYLDEHHRFGIAHLGPEILSNVCQRGFLARGERGELCGRLLVTVAHDIAIRNNSLGAPRLLGAPKPKFHQPVLVTDFLCALFAENYHRTVLGATPVTVDSGSASDSNPPRTLEEAFKDAYVSFSHFELAQDSEALKASDLRYSLIRGCAIQAKENQVSIDAVIPIHMGSTSSPIKSDTMSAINLQFKNRKHVNSCSIDRSTTIPDANQAVISIIFEFGDQDPPSSLVHVYHEKGPNTRNRPSPHRDDHHYTLVAHGYGSSTFNAVLKDSETCYGVILASGNVLQDFPRRDDPGLVAYLENLRPLQHARISAHLSIADERNESSAQD